MQEDGFLSGRQDPFIRLLLGGGEDNAVIYRSRPSVRSGFTVVSLNPQLLQRFPQALPGAFPGPLRGLRLGQLRFHACNPLFQPFQPRLVGRGLHLFGAGGRIRQFINLADAAEVIVRHLSPEGDFLFGNAGQIGLDRLDGEYFPIVDGGFRIGPADDGQIGLSGKEDFDPVTYLHRDAGREGVKGLPPQPER